MNKIVPWIKSNLLVVIALAVTLIALPLALFFSSGWNAQLRQERMDSIAAAERKLSGTRVAYELPALRAGEQAWTARTVPNPVNNQLVIERLIELARFSRQAYEEVVERNASGKTVLLEGLFPEPAGESERVRLSAEMLDVYPRWHADLLDRVNAGSPPPATEVLQRLEALESTKRQALLRGRTSSELTPEDMETLAEEMAQARVAVYREAASRLGVYATPAAFAVLAQVPSEIPRQDQYQELFWRWQHTAWVHEDLVAAVREANVNPSTGRMSLVDAPVKRILNVSVEPMNLEEEVSAGGSLASPLDRGFEASHTGRTGGNALYDTRYATMDVIVDAARLNDVIAAISETNLMTVVGVDVFAYDGSEDLARGFYYGESGLARAVLRIESVWIREWYDRFIPPTVREMMGLPEYEPPAEDDAGGGSLAGPTTS
jgi:hypothetical protein